MIEALFLQAMVDAALEPTKPIVADGSLHRDRAVGDKAGSKNLWYVLHAGEDSYGAFGSWKTGQSHTWEKRRPGTITPAQQAAFMELRAAAQKARESEQVAVHAEAASRAMKFWNDARPANDSHPYLMSKRVPAYGVRQFGQSLLVPLRDSAGRLHSLQFIMPDGSKRFLSGGRIRGCYFAIGRPSSAICVCEGYATAASVFRATGHATACAFNAGNLESVARALRGKFPGVRLTICADDDSATDGNPGMRYAEAAARAVRGYLAVPKFEAIPE